MMDIQRLRNLTTNILHTEMGHVYEDLGMLIGEEGLMSHMIPRAMKAIEPWLRDQVKDKRFWNGKYDVTHTGMYDLPTPTKEDQKTFFERFAEMPNPLAGEEVIGVMV